VRVGGAVGAHTAAQLGPWNTFGEVALLQECARTATVRCLERTELGVIDGGAWVPT